MKRIEKVFCEKKGKYIFALKTRKISARKDWFYIVITFYANADEITIDINGGETEDGAKQLYDNVSLYKGKMAAMIHVSPHAKKLFCDVKNITDIQSILADTKQYIPIHLNDEWMEQSQKSLNE